MSKIIVNKPIVDINGDEMAKFMSGNYSFATVFKIILSMPKIPFIKSFFSVVTR